MERIRSYDMADLAKATRLLHTRKSKHYARTVSRELVFKRDFAWSKDNEIDNKQKKALKLVDGLHEKHSDWINKKIQPSLTYLQQSMHEDSNTLKERVTEQYKDGLMGAITTLELSSGKLMGFNVQDAVVSYTTGFTTMLRVCERLDITPNSALLLAQQSYDMDGRKLAQLYQKHGGFSRIVLDRAAESENPQSTLEFYARKRKIAKQLAEDERYQTIPEHIRIRAASYHDEDSANYLDAFLEKRDLPHEEKRYTVPESDGFKIEGVPLLKQRHKNWCGYTSLSMVLQYWGYTDLTPEKLFTHVNGEYDGILEYTSPSAGPAIDTLALITQELTSLKVDLITERQHEKFREKNLEPKDILDAYLMRRKAPCIVRRPGHFKVATGVDKEKDVYIFNDPARSSQESIVSSNHFQDMWAKKDPSYRNLRDSSNLILAIYPPKT